MSEVKYTGECGGKLFGYISDEELHACKSWQWLKNHGYITEKNKDNWDYDEPHQTILWNDEFEEFIKLYIEDYNKYSNYGYKLSLDNFKKSLKAKQVLIEWA
jgi:hypothetical protein